MKIIKYLKIDYKLNNGNEKTFWFNLILFLKVNKIFIFLTLKQLNLIIILDYDKKMILIKNVLNFCF